MTLRNLTLFVTALMLPGIALCQRGDAQTLPYRAVEEWPQPATSAVGAPGPWNFRQVSGVAINSNGNVLVLHRGAHPILEFESSGKFVRSWGDALISEGKGFHARAGVSGRRAHNSLSGVWSGRLYFMRRSFDSSG